MKIAAKAAVPRKPLRRPNREKQSVARVAAAAFINWVIYSALESAGMSIWQQLGPWAARGYAAAPYTRNGQTLPSTWDLPADNLYTPKPAMPRLNKELGFFYYIESDLQRIER